MLVHCAAFSFLFNISRVNRVILPREWTLIRWLESKLMYIPSYLHYITSGLSACGRHSTRLRQLWLRKAKASSLFLQWYNSVPNSPRRIWQSPSIPKSGCLFEVCVQERALTLRSRGHSLTTSVRNGPLVEKNRYLNHDMLCGLRSPPGRCGVCPLLFFMGVCPARLFLYQISQAPLCPFAYPIPLLSTKPDAHHAGRGRAHRIRSSWKVLWIYWRCFQSVRRVSRTFWLRQVND
jgi:hypothetical protein